MEPRIIVFKRINVNIIQNKMMILYVIVIILIVLYILIRLCLPFWSRQPVFHIYNIWYYFVSPRIISEQLPRLDDKYVNTKNIRVAYGNDNNQPYVDEMVSLIRNHYLRSKDLNYLPEKTHIVPYLELKDVIILHYYYADKIIGTITLRPIDCILNGTTLPLQYVDYLCVHNNHRKKGIAQQLIRTLYYYQRHKTYYKISLFKNEGKQRAIMPLTIYDSYRLIIKKIPMLTLHPNYKLLKITDKNIHNLFSTLNNIKSDFKHYISINITNLLLLITTGNIELYCLSYKDTILSLYYVRNSRCYNKDNNIVKEIYATYKTSNLSIEDFQNGFQLLLAKMYKESPECIIENIGHSKWLIEWLYNKGYIEKLTKYIVGYYLYNYVYKTINSEELFINL